MPAVYKPKAKDVQAILQVLGLMKRNEDEGEGSSSRLPASVTPIFQRPGGTKPAGLDPTTGAIWERPRTSQEGVIDTKPAIPPVRPAWTAEERTGDALPAEAPPPATRPRFNSPVAQGERSRRVGEVPPPAEAPIIINGPQGQPRAVEGGGTALEQKEAMLKALENYKPTNNNSRVRSFLIGLGHGYLRGGGLLGALQGGIEHLVDPSADEKFQRARDVNKVGGEIAGEYGRRKVASDLENAETDRLYKAAQAQRVLNPVYKPDVVDTPEGPVSVNGTNAAPIYNRETGQRVPAKPSNTRRGSKIQWNAAGKAEMWVTENGVPTSKVPNWTDPSLDKVKTQSGNLVPQSTDEMARATEAERQYRHTRDEIGDVRHDTEYEEGRTDREETRTDRQQTKIEGRRKDAATLIGNIEEHKAEAAQWHNLASLTKDQATKDYYESLAIGSKAKAKAAATQLREGFGDIAESGEDSSGWAYGKLKEQQAAPAPTGGAPSITRGGKGVRPRVSRSKLNSLLNVQ